MPFFVSSPRVHGLPVNRHAGMIILTGKEDMMTMFRKIVVSIAIVLLTATSVNAQGYGVGTPLEAKKMVEKAVAYPKA